MLGIGCLVGLCEGDPFLCKKFRLEHTNLAQWMRARVWRRDNFAGIWGLEL